MRVAIAGGTGSLGSLLAAHLRRAGDDVALIARHPPRESAAPFFRWDGRTLGPWTEAIDGADVVINLAGRSVNCRPTAANRREIIASRVDSTRVVGEAIARAPRPPSLWMNASAATIYRHVFDRAMDEDTGEIGGDEPGARADWRFAVNVATSWEAALFGASTPRTRKVALRITLVMGPDEAVFDVLLGLVRKGLGGTTGSGRQYVSWIHDADLLAAVDFLIADERIEGPVNIGSPNPLPNAEFMRELRDAWGMRFGLPAPAPLVDLGSFFIGTDSELVLKSRRVAPARLLAAGFRFRFPDWREAARDLVARWRLAHRAG